MWSMTAKGAKTNRQGRLACRLANSGARPSYPCDITSSTAIGGFSGTVPEGLIAQPPWCAYRRLPLGTQKARPGISKTPTPSLSLSSVISVLFSSTLPSVKLCC